MNFSFRWDFLRAEARKAAYILLLRILDFFAPQIQKRLMAVRFENAPFDLIYVLAVSFLPTIIYSAISVIAFSIALSAVKMVVVPTHMLEKKYFGLKGKSLKASIIYAAIIVLVLYSPNYLNFKSGPASDIFSALPLNPPNLSASTANAAGAAYALFSVLFYFAFAAFLAPLYILSPLKVFSIIAGALYAIFLIHIFSIRALEKKSELWRKCSSQISEEGGWVTVATKIYSKVPIFSYIFVSSDFRRDGIEKSQKVNCDSDLFGTRMELEKKYILNKGFYSADIAEMWVITPPFFSKIYRVSAAPASVTVIPKTADITGFRSAPASLAERGSIISKKMMNSSSDFSGIKEYVPGDQLNRVWWMGFAKSGTLLTKNFYSTGEDSIILLPDLSDPNCKKEYGEIMMACLSNIVNICSKKDISISIYPVCSHALMAEPTRNKKELMFFIMNLNSITLISPKGAEAIFESALSREDYGRIRDRCKKDNITLSSFYGASGFYKKAASVFSWERKSVFAKSMLNFFKRQKKRSKAILITDSKVPLLALAEFRSRCLARKFRYVVIVLCAGRDKKELLRIKAMRARHVPAVPLAYADAKKVSKIYQILGERIL